MKNKLVFFIIIFLAFGYSLIAQEDLGDAHQASNTNADLEADTVDASRNIMLARSSTEYMVTPGDVYTLAYAVGASSISYTITVDTSYRIRVSNLGIVNGAGKTFPELRREVENIVVNNYPLSGVQLVLTQPAVFMVRVNGEVRTAGERSAWALTRLSSLTGSGLTGYASIRDISIKSSNGQTRVYDLYKAQRFGDTSQNPYLRPGDVITFNRIKRVVTVSGEVERPGRYQLLDGENIKELVNYYGNGFTPVADKERARLTRYIGSAEISGDIIRLSEQELTGNYVLHDRDIISIPSVTAIRPAVPVNRMERTISISGAVRRPGTYELRPDENLKELIDVYADGLTPLADSSRIELVRMLNSDDVSGNTIFLAESDVADDYALEHFDVINIPSVYQLRPVLFVEGAVRATREALADLAEAGTEELAGSTRLVVRFAAGETYASLVRRNARWFTAVSDTENAYVLRNDERIPVNLNLALYDAAYRGTVLVENEDVLVIPFRQYFVTVAGAVYRPGRYPYIPDRDWEYYIGLAGGFIPERNYAEAIIVTDLSGKRLKKTDAISPEATITARSNHGLYYFNQAAPIITTAIGIISTILTVIAITR